MEAAMQSATLVPVATGVRLNVSQTGTGEPLLLIMGTSGSLGFWEPLAAPFAEHHRVIAYDKGGSGVTRRGVVAMSRLCGELVKDEFDLTCPRQPTGPARKREYSGREGE